MPDLDNAVITVVVFFVLVSLAITTFSTFTGTSEFSGDEVRTGEPVLLDGTAQYTVIDDSVGQEETVYNSLGRAVELGGTDDSYVQSDAPVSFATDDTWTLSLWASVSPDAAIQQRTVVSLNGRVIVTYHPMAGNWSAWYYDEGSTNSYRVNVSAVNVNGQLQNVMVRRNATHLAIYQNNSVGDVENVTAESITDAPVSSANWHGRLEEIRTDDDALTSAQRQQLVDSPNAPLTGTNRTSRIMFDEASVGTQLIFFSDASLTQSNVSAATGHSGSVMDGKNFINDISGSTDYVWDEDGPRLYVVDGGELDGAPVAYVDYTFYPFGGTQQEWSENLERTLNLSVQIPLVIITVVVISYLLLLRQR